MTVQQSLVAIGGVLAGLVVGLLVPLINSVLAGRTSRHREQHAVADQILQLWQRSESIRELLAEDRYSTRRSLLLLGSRLQDPEARKACLVLVHLTAQPAPPEAEVVDRWTDVVEIVSKVFRQTEK
ncbi:hypothetical protein AB0M37_26315 [Micromonospora chalcea]